jgi:hypothetical protein
MRRREEKVVSSVWDTLRQPVTEILQVTLIDTRIKITDIDHAGMLLVYNVINLCVNK